MAKPKKILYGLLDMALGQKKSINKYVTVYNFFTAKYLKVDLNTNFSVVNISSNLKLSYLPVEIRIIKPDQVVKKALIGYQARLMLDFINNMIEFNKRDARWVHNIAASIVKQFRIHFDGVGIGVKDYINRPTPVPKYLDSKEAIIFVAIKNMFQTISISVKLKKLWFLLYIFSMDDVMLYNTIKRFGDIKAGIHTAGDINQTINKLEIVNKEKTMAISIDVTHLSPELKEIALSVATIVTSTDKLLDQ
ncbi:hypothetical protein EAE96_002786 [Botrytis aclada]|nr:hypothetical protein EAE96_002786 [Botrytis aclada]